MRTPSNKSLFKTKGWEREEHYNYFKTFSQPFIRVHAEVDITSLHHYAKWEGLPISLAYLHTAIKSLHLIENFKLRIEGDEVVKYEAADVSTPVLKENNTISFVHLPYHPDLHSFCERASEIIAEAKKSNNLFCGYNGPDLIPATILPWFEFNNIEPAQLTNSNHAIPMISFGKINWKGTQAILPVSVQVHQALADAYHIHLFLENMKVNVSAIGNFHKKTSRLIETSTEQKIFSYLLFLKQRLMKQKASVHNWLCW